MPRKPNYRFERSERDRAKAARKAERLLARAEKSATKKESGEDGPEDVSPGVESAETSEPPARLPQAHRRQC